MDRNTLFPGTLGLGNGRLIMSLLSLPPGATPWAIKPRNFPEPEEEEVISSRIWSTRQLTPTWFKRAMMMMITIMIYHWVTLARAKIKLDENKDFYLRTSYSCGHDVASRIRWISPSADYCLTHFATGNSRCQNCSRNRQAQYKWSCPSRCCHPHTTGLTDRDLRGSALWWVMKILEEWKR